MSNKVQALVKLLLCSNIPTFLPHGSPWLFNTTAEFSAASLSQDTHLSLSNLNTLTKQEFKMFETPQQIWLITHIPKILG